MTRNKSKKNSIYVFNIWNYNPDNPEQKSKVGPESLTEPGQSMSLRELVERLREGSYVQARSYEAEYDAGEKEDWDSMSANEISGLDIAELHNLANRGEKALGDLEKWLKELESERSKRSSDTKAKANGSADGDDDDGKADGD